VHYYFVRCFLTLCYHSGAFPIEWNAKVIQDNVQEEEEKCCGWVVPLSRKRNERLNLFKAPLF
tara:strand:+ start:3624 stop:3812 length:189 start_codon:yes stop_codon:yes gene_type:complete